MPFFVPSHILVTMDMITWLKIFFMNTILLFNNIQIETLKTYELKGKKI